MDLRSSSVTYWRLSATCDFLSHIEIQATLFCAIAEWSSVQLVASNSLPCLLLQLLILVQDYQQPSLAGLTESSIWEPFSI